MLSQIPSFAIEKYKQARLDAGHRVAVNRELSALSAMFNRCIEWGKFEGSNPKRKVKKVKEALTRLRFLSEQEEARLLAALREPQRTIVLLGLYMGLRIGAEALTLKKENVDLENGLLTIEAAYSKNGKTQSMPIHSCLIEPLRDAHEGEHQQLPLPWPEGKADARHSNLVRERLCNRENQWEGHSPYPPTHLRIPPRHEGRQQSHAAVIGTLGRTKDASALCPPVQ